MVASALTTFQMLNYGYVKVLLISSTGLRENRHRDTFISEIHTKRKFYSDVTGQRSWSPEYWQVWFGIILVPSAAKSTR